MLRGRYIFFTLLILLYLTPCESLPLWVHRVDSCPDPNDIGQWIQASERLNCYHSLTSDDPNEQAKVYHCLPTTFVNETVEFCSRSVPVAPGNCPVYNYKLGPNIQATYYNCSSFTSGCPAHMFHSKNVFKYQECLRINKREKCYEASKNCSLTTRPDNITDKIPQEQTSTRATPDENIDSVKVKKTSEKEDNNEGMVYIMSIALGVILTVISMIVGWYLFHKRKLHVYLYKTFFPKAAHTNNISEQELETLCSQNLLPNASHGVNMSGADHEDLRNEDCNQMQNGSSVCGSTDSNSDDSQHQNENRSHSSDDSGLDCNQMQNGSGSIDSKSDDSQHQNENRSHSSDDSGLGQAVPDHIEENRSLLKNIHNGATIWRYNDLLEKLKKNMTSTVFKRIKRRLKDRRENSTAALTDLKDAEELFDYLDKKYLAFHNVLYLQGLFLASKAPELYNICTEYAKGKEQKMTFFEQTILGNDHTKVIYKINCPDVSYYTRTDLEKLQESVALFTNAQFDDILVCGVKNGCVMVTFMIRNCLIPTLRALYMSEKQSMACHQKLKHKIIKVTINDEVVYPPGRLLTVDGLKSETEPCQKIKPLPVDTNVETSETHSKDLLNHDNLERTEDVENNIKGCPTNTALDTSKQIESQKFKDCLRKSFCGMTDDTFSFMKTAVQDVMDKECIKQMDKASLLSEMSDMIQLQHNMEYLEWIFKKCGETDLVNTCHTFLKGSTYQPEGFQTKVFPRCGNQTLEFHIMIHALEPDAFKSQMQDLRKFIADIINVHPGKILMTALEVSPIVVTYMMTKEQAGVFLRFLETDDGQIETFRKRVEKVITEGKIITIAEAINGRHYVHIHLRCRDNPRGLKGKLLYASSKIVQALGIKRDGRDVYTSIVSSDNQETDKHEESGDTTTFIEKNRDHLLSNLEPLALLRHHEFASCFDKDDMAKIDVLENRKDRAEHLLTMCTKLPAVEFEKVLPYLEESLPSRKTIRSAAELDSERNWIQENRRKLLDEIDSSFIEAALDEMKGVSSDDKALCLDGSKRREERAKHFLDVVSQNDENVMVFKPKAIAEFDLAN